jgi:hypothetical protein
MIDSTKQLVARQELDGHYQNFSVAGLAALTGHLKFTSFPVIAILKAGLSQRLASAFISVLLSSRGIFTPRLSLWPHEVLATLAFFSDQNLALRSDDLLDWP